MQRLAYRIGDTIGQVRETANVANKKMISRELVKEVHTEAANLRQFATDEELKRLDFATLLPESMANCVYGQMAKGCLTPRAHQLIKKCAKFIVAKIPSVVSGVTCELPKGKKNNVNKTRFYQGVIASSPIEIYIVEVGADNKQLIAFLKGERKTLNLYPTVNC